MFCSPHIELVACPVLGSNDLRMIATTNIAAKSSIKGLEGRLFDVGVDKGYFEEHYSVMKYSGKEHLLLGPISFVNHSCKPNAVFKRFSSGLSEMIVSVQALHEIHKGEEITCSYGANYFKPGDCLCDTCRQKRPQELEDHYMTPPFSDEVTYSCFLYFCCLHFKLLDF